MSLEYPSWLLFWIAVPGIAITAVLIGRFSKRPWESFAAERLRGKLIRKDHPLPRWLALGFLLVAISILTFTQARPQGDAGTKTEKSMGRNVMIALDLSRSMRVQDVNPDRLAQAKIVIYELLESLSNDRVGLIGFAGTPFLTAPLTIDHEAVKETVEQIDEDWVPVGGSDLAAAIQLATQTLKETGQKNNALILISDGEEHEGDLETIVADAARAGVTIFAIGVGTMDGGFVPLKGFPGGFMVNPDGSKVLSRLQPDVMRKLATETGGRYVIAGQGADITAMVKAALQGMDAFEMEGLETKIVIEFFQWALLPAILFLMASILAGTRWRGIAKTAVGVVLLLCSGDAIALSLKDARQAFSDRRFDDARDAYRSLAEAKGEGDRAAAYRLGEGFSSYNAQDFRGARTAYSAALLSNDPRIVGKAHEGIGNTLFQLGWTGLSGSAYPVGENVPDMAKFDELVRKQLKGMSEAEVPESGETNEFIRIDSIILNWTDAVRHYRSALVANPKDDAPGRNSDLTMKYLKRLQELLEAEKDRAQQSMPEPQSGQGEGQPQEGDGDGENQEGEGSGDQKEKGEGNGGDEEKEDGKGNAEGDKDKPKEKSEEEGENPNESPEERAGRILSENSDLEKGPLSPGRRDFRNPEKDW
ncbi:MAG: VWA domain-containing protein [Armatimonadetes bacterium]|nr:VWA domain-containing protein [Akkermansiaceae bacterium]